MPRPYPPDPEESGALEPPRRHPPTAVATATPPPPRKPHRPGDDRLFRSRVRIAACSVLASALGVCSVVTASMLTPLGLIAGATCLAVTLRLVRQVRQDLTARHWARDRAAGRRAA